MGSELHAGWFSGSLKLPLNPGLCKDRDQQSPMPQQIPKVVFPLFVLICEQIPLGRVPRRAWARAGGDPHLGSVVIKRPLHAESSDTAPCSLRAPNPPPPQLVALGRPTVLVREELQQPDPFSAENHREGSSKSKGDGQSSKQSHPADLGHVLATFQAPEETSGSRQTCLAAASGLKPQMLQVRERKGQGH